MSADVPRTPIRRCLGCGRRRPQSQLLRFVARNGELAVDPARRGLGRGAYTCQERHCFERAVARRAFSRALRRNVSISPGLNAAIAEV